MFVRLTIIRQKIKNKKSLFGIWIIFAVQVVFLPENITKLFKKNKITFSHFKMQ